MENIADIEDEVLGFLNGRDCVYIDRVVLDDHSSLIFEGEINGALASKLRADKWVPYKLEFKRTIAHFACELDTYERLCDPACFGHSDFTVIENSEQLAKLPIRSDFDRALYKHFRVFTYDVVFDIFAADYEFSADFDNAVDFPKG